MTEKYFEKQFILYSQMLSRIHCPIFIWEYRVQLWIYRRILTFQVIPWIFCKLVLLILYHIGFKWMLVLLDCDWNRLSFIGWQNFLLLIVGEILWEMAEVRCCLSCSLFFIACCIRGVHVSCGSGFLHWLLSQNFDLLMVGGLQGYFECVWSQPRIGTATLDSVFGEGHWWNLVSFLNENDVLKISDAWNNLCSEHVSCTYFNIK